MLIATADAPGTPARRPSKLGVWAACVLAALVLAACTSAESGNSAAPSTVEETPLGSAEPVESGLGSWSPPAELPEPRIEDVPRVLPDSPPVGRALRSESTTSDLTMTYVQLWARAAEDGVAKGLLTIETRFDGPRPPRPTDVEEVLIEGWAAAYREGPNVLVLADAIGSVSIRNDGTETIDLDAIARDLRVNVGGVGWSTPPTTPGPSWTEVLAGWSRASAMRSFFQQGDTSIIEVVVAVGAPFVATNQVLGARASVTEVEGRTAVVVRRASFSVVIWSPASETVMVVASTDGDPVEIAHGLITVDQATWEAAAEVDPGGNLETGCATLIFDC